MSTTTSPTRKPRQSKGSTARPRAVMKPRRAWAIWDEASLHVSLVRLSDWSGRAYPDCIVVLDDSPEGREWLVRQVARAIYDQAHQRVKDHSLNIGSAYPIVETDYMLYEPEARAVLAVLGMGKGRKRS